MSRCIAVGCWRRTVGISRWCREHTDMILDLPAAEWPMSRREAKVREQLRRAHWEPTTPPPTIQRGPVGPQAPGGAA